MLEKNGQEQTSDTLIGPPFPRYPAFSDASNDTSRLPPSRASPITMLGEQTLDEKMDTMALDKALDTALENEEQSPSPTRSQFSPTTTSFIKPSSINAEGTKTNCTVFTNYTKPSTVYDLHSKSASISSRSNFHGTHPYSRSQSPHFLFAHGKAGKVISENSNSPARHAGRREHFARKSILGGLIKPPVVRQFLHNDQLYKEEEDRGISSFELFADLVFVAIVHILGEVAAEQASWVNAIKFMLMFWPPWSTWADMRSYLNVSGTDDIVQRAYILLSSLFLIGYTAQGASINVGVAETRISDLRRNLHQTVISREGYEALRAATGFFIAAKVLRLIMLGSYAWALPRFRVPHLTQAFFTSLPCLVFIRLFFVSEVADAMGVFIFGVVLEVSGKYMAGLVLHLGATEKNKPHFFIPALELGHVIEKTAAFFVLVAGEILIAVSYVAHEKCEIGPHGEYFRSCLGIILSFLLCWVYFDADSCKVFIHAIRRHWFSSISWTQLHLPLCGGLVIVAASIHQMIVHNRIDQGLRWYFAIGMSVVMFCLGLMGALHRSLDRPGSSLLPRWARLGFRMFLGCAFPFFPLYPNQSSILELGFYCAGMGILVLIETVGKIGTEGNSVPPEVDQDLGIMRPNTHGGQSHSTEGRSAEGSEVEYVSGSKRFRREELTAYEKGEEDVGGQTGVGIMKAFSIRRGQRTGLAAF